MQTPPSSYPPPDEIETPRPRPRSMLRIDRTAGVSLGLIGITAAIYLLQVLTEWLWGVDVPAAVGLKANSLIAAGQWWRLVTPMFLHGSPIHLAVNMYALYILGPGLERYYGHLRFLALYMLAGFAGNAVSFVFSDRPSLGASTAIFGLIAAQAIFIFENRALFGDRAKRALQNVLFVALLNFIIGLSSPMIDNWGHLGGFLGGGLFALIGGPSLVATYAGVVVDRRSTSRVILAGATVLLIFGALAIWGIAGYAS